ncbi:uncharacterized protein [Polyergus mexicanus]|uniref:uncharacterized protein isoform X3 n=1 Tax=Polyergus mexicanus TaxID=615972 RepID=UPI0038B5D74E
MAIMQSCCCWQSVRRGSYACAVYTTIYFALVASTTGTVFREESDYLKGEVSLPESSSFLEGGTVSPTTVHFNAMLLICSCCGVLCSLLLLYGLYKDRKMLLLPWIIVIIICGIIDIAHSLYLFIVTIYSLLCIISQYQEYLAGRGTAAHDYEYRVSIPKISQRKEQWDKGRKVPVVRYVTQPPTTTVTTSCLSSRKGVTNNETKATPTQSPTACHNPLLSERSPTGSRISRKHVQFPDTSTSSNQIQEIPVTKVQMKCSPKIDHNNAKIWLQPNDAITIIISQSSPSSEEEHYS